MDEEYLEFALAFGAKVHLIRRLRGLSQDELADMVGISSNTLHRIEIGQCVTSVPVLVRLINALDVSADYMLQGLPEYNDVTSADYVTILLQLDEKNMTIFARGMKYAIDESLNSLF